MNCRKALAILGKRTAGLLTLQLSHILGISGYFSVPERLVIPTVKLYICSFTCPPSQAGMLHPVGREPGGVMPSTMAASGTGLQKLVIL